MPRYKGSPLSKIIEKGKSESPKKVEQGQETTEKVEKKEKVVFPEKERAFEAAPARTEKESQQEPEKIGESGGIIAASRQSQMSAARQKEIEKTLEKDLEDIYLNMSSDEQREFKVVGERTAREINGLLAKTKVKVNKIIGLIKKWLSLIPGVNKFFLEQEAKIKADEIMKIKNKPKDTKK